MKHSISVSGYVYKLRPVEIGDAHFIVKIRTEEADRNKYLHVVSPDISLQESWIREYLEREGDYYFVVENLFSGKQEGLIGIYDTDDEHRVAEWGRWILSPESLGASESVYLMGKVAFEVLGLESIYSRTVKANSAVVSFHDSLGASNEGVLVNEFEINGERHDAVKHVIYRDVWKSGISEKLERISKMVYKKILRQEIEGLEFHHIGVAVRDIIQEREAFEMLGYQQEGEIFDDAAQGIRGMFITAKNQPRLELLENLPGHQTLNVWLGKGVKFYHFAYFVDDIDQAVLLYTKKFRGKVISSKKPSVAFGLRNICFIMFSSGFVLELIEKK